MPELDACATIVRRNDHDRYLTCLFARAPVRGDLFALYAFNHEVAKTAEIVSEPLLGEIRLQWWRDRVDEIYDTTPRRHEVVEPLAAAVRRHGLTRGHFLNLIDGRALDLQPEAPATLRALEDYAEATSSSLLRLAFEVVGAPPAGEAAKHLGLAWALTGLIRAVPFHAAHKRLYLPREMTEAAGLDRRALFELQSSPQLISVAETLAARARKHLQAGRQVARQLPRRARPVALLAPVADENLRRLAAVGHDPFDARLAVPAPGRLWRLAWANVFGRNLL